MLANHTLFSGQGGRLLDQALPNFFTNIKKKQAPRVDSVALATFQELVDKSGYVYELTITLDPRNKAFKKMNLDQDLKAQWRYIKKQLLLYIDKYHYESIAFPEKHKNRTQLHAHCIIRFKQSDYDEMIYRKSTFIKRLRDHCGKQIKWARINLSHGDYMPSEKNYKINAKRSCAGWHKYCHGVGKHSNKGSLRKYLGIQDLVNF